MANLGTQEEWTPLTKTWHEARKRGLARFAWTFKDGPHRFQLVFDEVLTHKPGTPIAEMMLTSLNSTSPFSQVIGVGLSKSGNLFPTNAARFDEQALRHTLGIVPRLNTPHPWDMLAWVTRALESSTGADLTRRTCPHELSSAIRKDVEEANKIYYIFNARRGGPTPENLAKTRLLIGIDAAEYCQRHGRSTHWSDKPKDFSLTQWNQLLSELRPH
ncbi:DUF6037 family protein [Trueperella pyogenes]|uniref:DUF6037 family protein n=1 Tax=Trueperella pyogenes TaxID=1661 RepID=UPI00345DD01A